MKGRVVTPLWRLAHLPLTVLSALDLDHTPAYYNALGHQYRI
jgi:hypothetical protein